MSNTNQTGPRTLLYVSKIVLYCLIFGVLFSTFIGGVSAQQSVQSNETYYYGDTLEVFDDSLSNGDTVTIIRDGESNLSTTVSDGSAIFDTENFAQENGGSGFADTQASVESGDGTVLADPIVLNEKFAQAGSFDPQEVGTVSETSATVSFTTSGDGHTIEITETSGKLTASEISTVIDTPTTTVSGGAAVIENPTASQNISFDFESVSADTYEFEFAIPGAIQEEDGSVTNSTDTSSITVTERTADIVGTAQSEDGNDLSITLLDTDGNTIDEKTVTSGNQFRFEDQPVGTYSIEATSPRHDTDQKIVSVDPADDGGEVNAGSFNVSIQETQLTVNVNVATEDQTNTFPDSETIEVQVEGQDTPLKTQEVDDGGSTTFNVEGDDTVTVTVDSEFLILSEQEVDIGSDGSTQTIEMNPEEIPSGVLELNASTDGTVQQISVTAEQNGTEVFSQQINGSSGTVTDRLEEGEYSITVDAVNHQSKTEQVSILYRDTTSRTITLQTDQNQVEDGGTYFIGQSIDLSSIVQTDDSITFINEDSGQEDQRTVGDGDNFTVDTRSLGPGTGDYTVVVEQSEELGFTLEEETIDASFDSEVNLAADVQETTLSVNSNRDDDTQIDVYEIELPDGTVVDGTDVSNMSSDWTQVDDVSRTVHVGQNDFFELDFSESQLTKQEGEYIFRLRTRQTEAESEATLTVNNNTENVTDSLEVDQEIFEGGRFWEGQILGVDEPEVIQGESYDLLQDGSIVRENLEPRESDGVIVIDSEEIGTGENYSIVRNSDNTEVIESFRIVEQTLQTEIEDDSVVSTGLETLTDIEFESNRDNYTVAVRLDEGPEDLRTSNISSRIDGARLSEVNIDGETSTEAIIQNVSSSDDFTIDMRNLSQGTYTFEFVVVDSTAESTASTEIVELDDGVPSFTEQFYESGQGDVAKIEFEMGAGVETATMIIGSEERTAYEAHIRIIDEEPNTATKGELSMDTILAGQGKPEQTFSVETVDDDEDEEETDDDEDDVDTGLRIEVLREDEIPIEIFQGARYLLRLESDDTEYDISVLNHQDIGAEGLGSYVVPRDTNIQEIQTNVEDIDGSEEPERQREGPFYTSERVTQMDEVALGESVYLTYDMDGAGKELYKEGISATRFNEGSRIDREEGVSLEITQTGGSSANYGNTNIQLSETEYGFDEQNGVIWFKIDTGELDQLDPEDEFTATLTIDEENNKALELVEDTEEIRASTTFTVVENEIDWGMDPVEVEAESDWTIVGDTPYAPTTDIEFVARSTDRMYPFLRVDDTEINEDGTVTGNFDFRDVPEDTEFEVLIRDVSEREEEGVSDIRYNDGGGYQLAKVVENAQQPEFDNLETLENAETVEMTVEATDSETDEAIDGAVATYQDQEVTLEDGSGVLNVPQNSIVTVSVNDEEYNQASRQIETSEESFTEEFTLQKLPESELTQSYEITVTAQDATSAEPISDATITVDGEETGTTRQDGTLPVVVDEGDRTITASAEGYESQSQDVTVTESRTLILELEQEGQNNQTPENNTTPTPTDGESEGTPDNDSVRSEGQDGFGIIITAVAFIMALTIAMKRKSM